MKKFLSLVAFSFSMLLLGACAGSSASSPPESTAPPSTGPAADNGMVADYLNGFDAARLNGIYLPRGIATDRARVAGDIEERFVAATREDPNSDAAAATFAILDDDALVYLGYVYCAAMDARLPIDRSVATVVDVVARVAGRDATAPATDDFIVSVTVVNLASGSLCPELYLDTRAFLEELTQNS